MKKINLNILAVEIAKLEGKKINLSIAQVKEVLRHTLSILAKSDVCDVFNLIARVGLRSNKIKAKKR